MQGHCSPRHSLGRQLEEEIPALVGRYRDALEKAENPLGKLPELWEDTRTHADLILTRWARALDIPDEDESTGIAAALDLSGSSSLGTRRAISGVRLVDSLRALETLTHTALATAERCTADAPADVRHHLMGRAAQVLNRIGSQHTQAAVFGYDAHLLRQIDRVNTGERDRLARDIHDLLGNSLALAFRHLELYRMTAAGPEGPRRTHLAALDDALQEAVGFTRGLISGLRHGAPLISLEAELRDCAGALNFRGLPVRVTVSGDETWLPVPHRTELFLILREFLRNSFTHAAPQCISIDVCIRPGRVEAAAYDDGRGFDHDDTRIGNAQHPEDRAGHQGGLVMMRERARELDGNCQLHSRPGAGTRLTLWLPLPEWPGTTDPGDSLIAGEPAGAPRP